MFFLAGMRGLPLELGLEVGLDEKYLVVGPLPLRSRPGIARRGNVTSRFHGLTTRLCHQSCSNPYGQDWIMEIFRCSQDIDMVQFVGLGIGSLLASSGCNLSLTGMTISTSKSKTIVLN